MNLFNYKDFVDINTYADEGSNYRRKYLQLKPNTPYRMTIFNNRMSPSGDSLVMFIGDKETFDNINPNGSIVFFTSANKKSATITTKESGQIVFKLNKNSTPELQEEYLSQADIILSEGSTEIPYEPYTGDKPSPSPDYPQEIKNVGKYNETTGKYDVDVSIGGNNLLKEEFSEFKIIGDIAYIPLPKDHNNHKYTMLIQKKSNKVDTVGFTCGFYDHENMSEAYKSPCLVNGKLINKKGIVTSRQGVNHWVCFKPADEKFFDIYNVMYVEGEFRTLQYQPCIEPQTIKLSLEHPLRSIGDYKDEVTKDGIVRNIHRFEYDGSENWVLHNNTSKEKTQAFGINISTMCKGVNLGGICNRLLPRYTVWMGDNEGFDIYANHTLYINLEKTKASNIEEFKTWLSKNKVEIEAIRESHIIEPLPEEVKLAIESLHGYYPTTVITTDGGELDPDVEVTYIADTKNYIDQKIDSVVKTVVETQKALL